ncbi:MAG: porin [Chromatiales bacterium]|nr:porin [Chromatiales bacterium]
MNNLFNKTRAGLMATISFLFFTVIVPQAVFAQTDEITILKQQMRELQERLNAMQEKLESVDENVTQNAQAVEATAEAVESYGSTSSFWDKTSMGGYGELHYNNLSVEGRDNKKEIDFHRFVLFFGHEFNDRLRFFSEVELEHALAGDDQPGEVELEQAFIEYDFNERNTARAGVFLLPIGIMNETHEPPSFYGVERNTVENVIIPTAWWAGGVAYTHRMDNGFSFDLALHEGLKIDDGATEVKTIQRIKDDGLTDTDSDGTPDRVADGTIDEVKNTVRGDGTARIRSGRQKTALADADNFAVTSRVKYTGMPGLELAAGLQYQSDITQDSNDSIDGAILYVAHMVYSKGPFGLRALYAGWDLDVDSQIEDPQNIGSQIQNPIKANDYDQQQGWYVEPSFRLNEHFGVFARYEDVEGGRSQDEFDQWSVGFNYWLSESTVFKADFVDREHDNRGDRRRDFDGFNLGVGYEF